MLDLEKMTARARSVLISISVVGLLVMATGLVLTIAVVTKESQRTGGDWIDGHRFHAAGPMMLAAIGALDVAWHAAKVASSSS